MLARLRGEIELLQRQAHGWLFTAERFGCAAFRWEDYATDFDPDPGSTSRHLHGEDGPLPAGIGFPYLPSPDYVPPRPPPAPPRSRRGPVYGLVGQPAPPIAVGSGDPDAYWVSVGYNDDAFSGAINTCPKPAPGVERYWRARNLERNPIKAQAFRQAMTLLGESSPSGRNEAEARFPELFRAAGLAANWPKTRVLIDGTPYEARAFALPAQTLICLIDLPDAYVVLLGRPLTTADIALQDIPNFRFEDPAS